MLEKATQGKLADFLGQPGAALNDIYLIVNTVDDLPSGAYVFHRDLKVLELLKEETTVGKLVIWGSISRFRPMPASTFSS